MLRLALLFSALALSMTSAVAAPAIPPLPTYFVLDEPSWLSESQRKSLETLLIEHDQATGVRLMVGIFKSLEGEDPAKQTRAVYEDWLANRGQHKAALLAIYASEQDARIEAGFGLQALDEATGQRLIREFLAPELESGPPFRAISLSVLEVLRNIGSPLIESGRAQTLLRDNGLQGPLEPASAELKLGVLGWVALCLLTVIASGLALYNVLAAEAHFTGEGWYRPKPWKLPWRELLKIRGKADGKGVGGLDGHW